MTDQNEILRVQIDVLKEENTVLKNKVIRLETQLGNASIMADQHMYASEDSASKIKKLEEKIKDFEGIIPFLKRREALRDQLHAMGVAVEKAKEALKP